MNLRALGCNPAARHSHWARARQLLLVLLMTTLTLGLGIQPASAVADISVDITRDTPLPVASGGDIVYQLRVQCAAVDEPSCHALTATIALPPEVSQASVASHPYVESATFVRGTGIVIKFIDPFPAGTALDLPITMNTENGYTPDGFTWDVPVELTADNAPTVTASSDGRVSATGDVSIDKTVDPGVVRLDTPARYTIKVCDPTNPDALGTLYLESGSLVDQLPAGAQFVKASAGGVYDPADNTVTWPIEAYEQHACSRAGTFWLDVTYDSNTFGTADPLITQVTNSATVRARPYGETQPLQATDTVTHRFTSTANPSGVFGKTSRAPLCCLGGVFTYPGKWLPGDSNWEASWELNFRNNGTVPVGVAIHDRLPCSYPYVVGGVLQRSAHVSPLAAEPVCTAPTFVTQVVDINLNVFTNPAAAAYRAAIESGYAPTWVSTSGATGSFALSSIGPNIASFLPTGMPAGDRVSEVLLPADASLVFPPSNPGITPIVAFLRGNMIDNDPVGTFAALANGAAVVNRADFQMYYSNAPVTGPGGSASVTAQINVILPAVRAQIGKLVLPTGEVVLTGTNAGDVPLTGAIITDLLPLGVTFRSLSTVSLNGGTNLAAIQLEVIDDYAGTGRQLVRATLRPGWAINPPSPGTSALQVSFTTFGLSTSERPPGATTNTAQFHLAGAGPEQCRTPAGALQAPATNDADDLDGDGRTDDRLCAASATVNGPPSGALLVLQKLVRGDRDSGFAGFPTVGSSNAGGTGQFRLQVTNRSSMALDNVVIYDVLPRVGDTGVRLTTVPRMSDFDARLTGEPTLAGAPAGASIEYSTAPVPCRGELNQQPPGDWPTNCTDDWSTMVPSPITDVTGIRVNLGRLAANASSPVTITYPVSVPASTEQGDVAWNSFAAAANRADNGRPILPTETPKVGLAVPQTDIALDKAVNGSGSATVPLGSTVHYKITARHGTTVTVNPDGSVTYTNPDGSAPSTARNVIVRDVLPNGVALVPGSSTTSCGEDAPGGTFDEGSGVWTVGDIDPGDSFSLCFDAVVTGNGLLTNNAEVDAAAGPDDIDSTPGNMGNTPAEDDEDSATVTVLLPGIDLVKQVETSFGSNVWVDADEGTPERPIYEQGKPIRYRFLVTNTGDVPLTGVTITDPKLTSICPGLDDPFSLAVDQQVAVICNRAIGYPTGVVVNTADVTGQPPFGNPVTDTDTAQVEVLLPLVQVIKYTNGEDANTPAQAVPLQVGDDVTWAYVVTNTGTEPLVDLSLVDDQEGTIDLTDCERSDGSAADSPLQPGATITCELTALAGGGLYSNVATVEASGETTGAARTDSDPSHYIAQQPFPDVTIVKTTRTDTTGPAGEDADDPNGADAPYAPVGSDVSWIYTILNSGDIDLVLTSLTDDIEQDVNLDECTRADGLSMADPLPPGGTAVCRHDGGDGQAGLYSNVGTVVAQPVNNSGAPTGGVVTDDNPSHYYGGEPGLEIVKDVCKLADEAACDPDDDSLWAQRQKLPEGSLPVWRITVTNVGNITLDHVILTDQVAPGCEQDLGTLDPGETVRVACQSDEQLIQHTRNVAVATGTPVDQSGNPIIDVGTGEPIDVPPVSDDAVAEPQHHDTDNPDDPHGHGGHHHDGNEPGDGDGSGGGGTSPTPDTSSGWLPNTGAAAGMPMLIAMGLLALLIGSVLLIRERRRNIR